MNLKKLTYLLAISLLILSCSSKKHEGPFNYNLIKNKLNLTLSEIEEFDKIIGEYNGKLVANFQTSGRSKSEKMKNAKEISSIQDSLIKLLLSKEKYSIYKTEIDIERKGRDQHNMNLIKAQLSLDSLQTKKFEAANKAFYTTLIGNHDYYHGKPDVYLQYYKEIDANRQNLFEKMLTKEQLNTYNKLKSEYKIGQNEH
ncbi:hypothetical protein SAMN04489761_2463 [Tenacibaculum sp. MAR_2009_124]|uniref:hypothetical protein n=1 Tax=Tenacibaculum sp. MAR_2009_124 TaxID=1250059 RepID=UPI0008973E06|nr:hypothetical protein [Tenacibaculum sp. MAR_2009_124]SEC24140.1 hypothetical protein SAMN04489761_2463 [Tenacibaculum sp. MAR_2009_124]